jgi:hypothetical protein
LRDSLPRILWYVQNIDNPLVLDGEGGKRIVKFQRLLHPTALKSILVTDQ